jgi:hypothetical protein
LAAVFSGLAMGVKYTGFFPALGVMLIYAYAAHSKPFTVLKDLSVFTVIASVLVGPWLIKNYIYTGNPLYPFMTGFFGAGQSDPQKLKDFIGAASQIGRFQLKLWLTCPWNITMGNIPNSSYFSAPRGFFISTAPLAAKQGPKSANRYPGRGLRLRRQNDRVCPAAGPLDLLLRGLGRMVAFLLYGPFPDAGLSGGWAHYGLLCARPRA